MDRQHSWANRAGHGTQRRGTSLVASSDLLRARPSATTRAVQVPNSGAGRSRNRALTAMAGTPGWGASRLRNLRYPPCATGRTRSRMQGGSITTAWISTWMRRARVHRHRCIESFARTSSGLSGHTMRTVQGPESGAGRPRNRMQLTTTVGTPRLGVNHRQSCGRLPWMDRALAHTTNRPRSRVQGGPVATAWAPTPLRRARAHRDRCFESFARTSSGPSGHTRRTAQGPDPGAGRPQNCVPTTMAGIPGWGACCIRKSG